MTTPSSKVLTDQEKEIKETCIELERILGNRNGGEFVSALIFKAVQFWNKKFKMVHVITNQLEFETLLSEFYKDPAYKCFNFEPTTWTFLWEIISKSLNLFQFSFLVLSIGNPCTFRSDASEPSPGRVIELIHKSKIHLISGDKYQLSEQETKETLDQFSDSQSIQVELQTPLRCVFHPFSGRRENVYYLSKHPSIECVFSLSEGFQVERSNYTETNRLNLACTILNETVNMILVNRENREHTGFIGLDRKNQDPLGFGATFYIVPAENLLYSTIDVRRIRKLLLGKKTSLGPDLNFQLRKRINIHRRTIGNRHPAAIMGKFIDKF